MMKASRSDLARIVADQTLAGRFSSRQAQAVAAYLLETNRTGDLNSLLRDVQADWAERGTIEVVAASARPLGEAAERDIEREVRRIYPNAKRIMIAPQIDPSLVGGVRLSFTGHQLDLSVAGELRKFKTLAVRGKE